MKKFFGFGSKNGLPTSPENKRVKCTSPYGYDIQEKDLGKIHKAATVGNVAKVRQILLLRRNGINDKDKMNRTALHLACANGHVRVVSFLAKRKCQLDLVDNENRTALMKAVQCQEEECTTILLNCGADPNTTDVDGNTALHHAVLGQNTAIVAKLLAHKANMKAINKDGFTPLLLVVSEKKEHMVEILVKAAAEVNPLERTALHSACVDGTIEEVNILARSKVLLNFVDNENRTALMKAVQYQEEECVTILLDRGADPNDADNDGNTALHHAVLGQNTAIVAKLLAHKANTKVINKDGLTPLILAVSDNTEEMVEFFVKESRRIQQLESNHQQTSVYKTESSPESLSESTKSLVNKKSEEDSSESLSSKRNIDDSWPTSEDEDFDFNTKKAVNPHLAKLLAGFPRFPKTEEATKPATEKKGNDKISALGEDEDTDSPWDSESFSASLPQNYVVYLPEAADQRGKNILTGQVEDSHEKISSSKAAVEVKDPLPKKAVGTSLAQTSRSDSPEKISSSKAAVEVKDPLPEKAVRTTLAQTSRSDSPESFSSSKCPIEMTDCVFQKVVRTNSVHTHKSDSREKVSSSKAVVEVKDLLPKKALRMNSERTSRSDSPESFSSSKCPIEMTDCVLQKVVRTNSVHTHKSDSREKVSSSKAVVEVKDLLPKKALRMNSERTSRSDSPESFSSSKCPIEMTDCVLQKVVRTNSVHTHKSDSREKVSSSKAVVEVKDLLPKKALRMNSERTSRSDSPESFSSSKCPIEMTDCVLQKVVRTNSVHTHKSDSPEKVSSSKAVVEVKDPLPKKALRMNSERTSRSDSPESFSSSKCPIEMTDCVLQKVVRTNSVHTHKSDSPEKVSSSKAVVEVKDPLPKKALRMNSERTSRSDSPESFSSSKCPIEMTDCVLQKVVRTNSVHTHKSDSPEKVSSSKAVVEVKDPLPKKALRMNSERTSRSDSPESFSSSKCPIEMTDCVLQKVVRTNSVHTHKSDSPEKVSSSKAVVEVKDPLPKKALRMNSERTSRSDSPESFSSSKCPIEMTDCVLQKVVRTNSVHTHKSDSPEKVSSSKAVVEVKDPLPKKALRMNSERTSRSDSPESFSSSKCPIEMTDCVFQKVVRTNSVHTHKSDLEVSLGEEEERLDGSENNHPQVYDSYEKGKHLLHEKHVLQAKTAKLRLEIDTVKNQNQEMEEKYFKDIVIVKENNDLLQKTLKVNEKAFKKTVPQYNGQLNVLTAENTILKSKLETENQNKERLETEIESYRSRLATAVQDHEQSETSKRDLQRDFQRARDEWLHLRDKMNCDMSDLQDRNEVLSQQLSKAESKFSNLETELHHTRDALREQTLVLEGVQRDLSQTQCQKKEIEHMYQKEQGKVNKYIGKQGSLEERLSQLQSENEFLRQQLDDAHNKADSKDKAVINIREQFQDIIKIFQAESEKHALMLNERNMELIDVCNHLKERMHECENNKEKDVTVGRHQQELAGTLKTQSMSEASLQTTSHSHMNLEDEALDIQKKLDQSRSQVYDSYEKGKHLLHEKHVLQAKTAKLRLEIDTVKNQNQEMEEKYFKDIVIVKENNDLLQKTLKVNEKAFKKTVPQYNGQLNVLTAENTILKSKLETENQNKERLETEIESYRSRLATAVQDHEQSETSKRDLQRDFQRARDEWLHLRDKMNCDMSDLQDRNEVLSQQLSKAESKFSNLETELHHTRDALREQTLVLEGVQRDLSQTQCQKKEIEHMYQKEQGKVNKYIGKQGSLEERLSQLQSENEFLRQQLDDAHNKADSKDKAVINIREQFQDIIKIFQAESEKHALMLNERNMELIDVCNHLKERMHECENNKEKDVTVGRHQQELAGTLKTQSMSEASLQTTSHSHMNLEDEALDIQKKLDQSRSQLQEAQDRCAAAERCAEETQDHMQKYKAAQKIIHKTQLEKLHKLEIENANLKVTIKEQSLTIEQLQTILSQDEREQLKKYTELKKSLEYSLDQEMKKNSELEKEITGFKKLLKVTKRKPNEYENGELSFPGDLKPNQIEVDIQINMLKHENSDLTAKLEAASSKCQHLDEKNKWLQQELLSMKALQKKCEKLKNENRKWKQEGINLKTHMEMNMVEFSELQQYKRKIEERARRDIEEKLEEVNLFLQTQAASQENLEQLRENHNASIRSQLELRIKDLESELAKIKISQNSKEINLEKYKQLYLEEIESRKSLANILNKTNERLAELSTDLLLQKQQHRSSLSTLHPQPGLGMPCVGNLNSSLVLYGNCTPRENLVVPTSRPQTSSKSMETYLIKMRQEFEKTLTRELKEDAAELEAEAYRACPVASTDQVDSCQDLLLKTSREYAQILQKNYMI